MNTQILAWKYHRDLAPARFYKVQPKTTSLCVIVFQSDGMCKSQWQEMLFVP